MLKKSEYRGKKSVAFSLLLTVITSIFSIAWILSQAQMVTAQSEFTGIPQIPVTPTNPVDEVTALTTSFSNFGTPTAPLPLPFQRTPLQVNPVTGLPTISDPYFDPEFVLGTQTEGRAITQAVGESGVVTTKSVEITGEAASSSFSWGNLGGALLDGLFWSGIVVGAIQLIGGFAGADQGLLNAASIASTAGIMGAYATLGVFGEGSASFFAAEGAGFWGVSSIGWASLGVGVVFAAVAFSLTYSKESQKVVTFQCLPWEAPLGGNACETCNEDPFRPCSEYRCRSLGQACELVNSGTEEERCVWVNPNDAVSPTITPWDEALTENHVYANHDTRPTSLGTKITRTGGACLAAFTPIRFGIELNEPGQCKIDYVHTDTFEDMQFFMNENNYYQETHSQQMSLPSPDALAEFEGLTIGQGGIYDFYIRCRDKNGNENVDEYVVSFCVDDSPDTTPPIIVGTSIEEGSPVAFGVQEVPLTLYVNEPAECRWGITNTEYDVLPNEMSCSTQVYQQNGQQLYECSTTLTGINDREVNQYYFRCKDQPNKPENERNVNTQGHSFTLRGTQELDILSVSPQDEIIKDSTEVVEVTLEVETSNGADEGEAICYFSPTGEEGSYVTMFETDSFAHKQTLTLLEGAYEYFFRCIDAGGNSAETTTSFMVETDTEAPMITRAYKEGVDALKIVTNEPAECSYSLNNCNFVFEEGLEMIYSNPSVNNVLFAEWNPSQTYYIKCRDEFNNQPSPSACSIIASATTIN